MSNNQVLSDDFLKRANGSRAHFFGDFLVMDDEEPEQEKVLSVRRNDVIDMASFGCRVPARRLEPATQ